MPGKRRLLLLSGVLTVLAIVAIGQGITHWQARQFLEQASLEELVARAQQQPDNAAVLRRLGERAREQGDKARALEAYEKAAQLAPDHEETWLNWARTAGEVRGALAAEAILTAFLKQKPENAAAHLELALLYAAAEDYKRAEEQAREATRLSPDLVDAWRMLGQVTLAARRFTEAEGAFREAIQRKPQDWRPRIGLARTQIEAKKYTEALATAREAVPLASSEPEVQLVLGRAQFETAQSPTEFETARQSLKQVLSQAQSLSGPNRLEAVRYMGEAYLRESRWQEALPWLEKAALIAPGSVEVQFALIRAYRGVGDKQKAQLALERQKVLDRYQTQARELLARIAEQPQNPDLRLQLARLYSSFGNFVDAAKIYKAMIASKIASETAERELRELSKRYVPQP